MTALNGRSLISVDDLTNEEIELIFKTARHTMYGGQEKFENNLKSKVVACLFYEASTRTYASFISAISRLGGNAIPIQGVSFSSVSKGENLQDTIATLCQFADLIVLRHPENNAAEIARSAAKQFGVPVINAGSGSYEHPTQCLLDLFTVFDRLKTPADHTFSFIGDLKYSRTVHSLIKVLWRYQNVKINLISPPHLQLQPDLLDPAKKFCKVKSFLSVQDVIKETDCFYLIRSQSERQSDAEKKLTESEMRNGCFSLNSEVMKAAKKDAVIMHPFPRNAELNPDLDSDPRSAYFDQIRNGLFIRMSLLSLILS